MIDDDDILRARRSASGVIGALATAIPFDLRSVPRAIMCSRCGDVEVKRPGTFCGSCQSQIKRETLAANKQALIEQIPPHFRWARFNSPDLAKRCGERAVSVARDWRGRLLVLRGGTTVGKTSLACALVNREIDSGNYSVAFVECEEISPDAPDQKRAQKLLSDAMRCRFVVFDDLGQDLSGAPIGGGILAIRGERARRVIRHRHKNDLRTVVTLGIEDQIIRDAYGDDILGRLTEDTPDSLIVRMKGAAK